MLKHATLSLAPERRATRILSPDEKFKLTITSLDTANYKG